MRTGESLDVAIIGAGPYGISLGLTLKAMGIGFRVFGPAMKTWREGMPKGMDLKSEGYASTIYDPTGRTLGSYAKEVGHEFKPVAWPVPLKLFCEYGMDCYGRLGSLADPRSVVHVESLDGSYRLTLDDGSQVDCRRVVVAAGITHFASLPDQFQGFAKELVSHSSEQHDMSWLQGKEVLVIGAGASAIDTAVLAAEAGVKATMVCRGDIEWNVKRNDPRSIYEMVRWPESCMGPGVKSCLYEKSPMGFKMLPSKVRNKIALEFAGPSGGWSVHERFDTQVPNLTRTRVTQLEESGGRLKATLVSEDGLAETRDVDHVICATGYHADVSRLEFLSQAVRERIASLYGSPVLDSGYQSTAENLFFVGKAAALTFGPLMRFVCGTEYASKRLGRRLARG